MAFALMIGTLLYKQITGLALCLFACLAYTVVQLVLNHRSLSKKIFLGYVIFAVSLSLLDAGLTLYHRVDTGDEWVNKGDVFYVFNTSEDDRHGVQWVSTLRDAIRVQPYVKWMANGMPSHKQFERVTVFLMCIALSILYVMITSVKWLRWVLFVPIAVFAVSWYLFYDYSNWTYIFYFIGLLLYLIMARNHKKLEAESDYLRTYFKEKTFLRYALLMSVLFFTVGFTTYKLLPIGYINQSVSGLIPNLWGVRSEFPSDDLGIFSLIQTPYSDVKGYLGGSITDIDDETPLFWLTMETEQTKPLYLRSVVRDYYTGKRWVNQTNYYKNQYSEYLNNAENQNAVERAKQTVPKYSGLIRMDEMKTLSLFVPMGFYESDLNEDDVFVSMESEAFYKSSWIKKPVNQYVFKATGEDFNFDTEMDYLQLSDSLHKGVFSITRNLERYGKTDEDKMNVFVDFLRTNYKYSLEVPSYQEIDDFSSNFILHMDSGYCTYFASALGVMGRIAGIPTRYVEGFVVLPDAIGKGETVKVTQANAHAWVEAYIEGKGWVLFEATAPYSVDDVSGSGLDLSTEEVGIGATEQAKADAESNGTVGAYRDENIFEEDYGNSDPTVPIRERDTASEETVKERFFVRYKKGIFGSSAFVLLLVLVVVVGPSHFYLYPKNLRKRAIRRLYFLTYMAKENNGMETFDVAICLKRSNLSERTITNWEGFLYGGSVEPSKEMILEINGYLKRERKIYRYRFGHLGYMKLRWHLIRKAIGA